MDKKIKEYKEWLQNPETMAKKSLFVDTKDKSIKVRPKFVSLGLYKGLINLAKHEPGKTKMLLEATKKMNSEEKAALFQIMWEGKNKSEINKKAQGL